MDSNAMMLLGLVKMQNPVTKHVEMVEVRGFDVVGFLFPFIRLIAAGMWGKAALFVCTFYVYPIWSWYLGFNFKKLNFEQKIKTGWVIVEEKKQQAQAA